MLVKCVIQVHTLNPYGSFLFYVHLSEMDELEELSLIYFTTHISIELRGFFKNYFEQLPSSEQSKNVSE